MNPAGHIDSELASFREQWRAEVRARKPAQAGPVQGNSAGASFSTTTTRRESEQPSKKFAPPPRKPLAHDHYEDYVPAPSFDGVNGEGASSSAQAAEGSSGAEVRPDPITALDHYERAVEKEVIGSLGESLALYRKAYRVRQVLPLCWSRLAVADIALQMDHRVDQKYKNKHFPPSAFPKRPQPPSSTAAALAVDAQNKPLDGQPQSMKDLIESFAGISLQPAPPQIEGTSAPPCPIADLPEEILVHILRDVAILDVADFVRLAQVCKRFAYLVATEDRIWRRVCEGHEVGFGGMHFHWHKGLLWDGLDEGQTLEDIDLGLGSLAERRREESLATTNALLHTAYSSSWQRMFRSRPRIRFNGCYISTVNYVRSGQASPNQVTWGSPVHIVTYYRYLRFFRDGTAISLLTTSEPADVVHHLTKDLLALHRGGAMAYLPSAVMQQGLKGRWRLSSTADNPDAVWADAEGDLFVETEGIGKYMYRMDLSMRVAGRRARNNKLEWRGFYSYNKLTDDWAEFGLKNDKAFFFSRVKSYGAGE